MYVKEWRLFSCLSVCCTSIPCLLACCCSWLCIFYFCFLIVVRLQPVWHWFNLIFICMHIMYVSMPQLKIKTEDTATTNKQSRAGCNGRCYKKPDLSCTQSISSRSRQKLYLAGAPPSPPSSPVYSNQRGSNISLGLNSDLRYFWAILSNVYNCLEKRK